MSKPVTRTHTDALFEIGGQWIGTETNRVGFYRYWYQPGTQTVRRKKLRSANLEDAKLELAQIILSQEEPTISSPLAQVLLTYHEEHSDKLPSRKLARMSSRKLLAFVGAETLVEELTDQVQEDFVRQLAAGGASIAYIMRIQSVIAAAFAHAKLDSPRILMKKARIEKLVGPTKPPRRVTIPTDAEFQQITALPMSEPLYRWLVISLATGARPEAALDLRPEQRADGLINLLPPGRTQNKKFRSVVREPAFLTRLLDQWAQEESTKLYGRFVSYASVSAVQTALDRIRAETGIRISAYSCRHKVTTILRRAKRKGVTEDDIAAQLGHKRPNLRVTGGYGEYDPDYLEEASAALDAWLVNTVSSHSPPTDSGRRDPVSGKYLAKSVGYMVGGTGIEPVTPTMSTWRHRVRPR